MHIDNSGQEGQEGGHIPHGYLQVGGKHMGVFPCRVQDQGCTGHLLALTSSCPRGHSLCRSMEFAAATVKGSVRVLDL